MIIDGWGPTQSFLRNVQTMNIEQIKSSIEYLEMLLNSEKFSYDPKMIIKRLADLKEQVEFLTT